MTGRHVELRMVAACMDDEPVTAVAMGVGVCLVMPMLCWFVHRWIEKDADG